MIAAVSGETESTPRSEMKESEDTGEEKERDVFSAAGHKIAHAIDKIHIRSSSSKSS
jgi:hypothetical protein